MLYDFLRGPMVWVTFILFISGMMFQIIRFLYLIPKWNQKPVPAPSFGGINVVEAGDEKSFALRFALLKQSLVATNPLFTGVSILFHILVLVIPLSLLAHNALLDESWRISFYSLKESTSDVLTLIFLGCCLFFLLRRVLVTRVRVISYWSDYLILLLAMAPFLTGFLAYHQFFDYEIMLISHIISGELMLIAIPFTKLIHMIMFFANRLFY